jgi:hypothetical protein
VLVQDGLHELRRPVLGLTEMLRVARRAVVVIEPHGGLVARLMGTVWEVHEDGNGIGGPGTAQNYVFRWNRRVFRDVARSYLLDEVAKVEVVRFWDHNVTVRRLAEGVGGGRLGLAAAKATYMALNAGLWWMGNAMAGIVLKHAANR